MIFPLEIDAHPKNEADGKPRPNQGAATSLMLAPAGASLAGRSLVGGAENPVIPVSEKGL
jgi:hypothetical protein